MNKCKKSYDKSNNVDNIIEENMTEKKLNKLYENNSMFKKVFNIILWFLCIGWMLIVLIDYNNVSKKNDPYFCLKAGINKYSDGEVKWCLGLGYIVYQYNRTCYTTISIKPFWSDDKSINDLRCNNE